MLLLVASLALCGSLANAGIFSSSSCSGKTVPSGVCALLFDDDDCGGWEYQVPRGYSELSWGFTGPRKNDAESVLVRRGCRFIGYDHADRDDIQKRGDSVTVGVVLPRARDSPTELRVASRDLVL